MKKTRDILHDLDQLHVPASVELDERVYGEIAKAAAAPVTRFSAEPSLGQIIDLCLTKKSALFALATVLGLLVVALVLNHTTTSAFAMDQAVEAIKKYKGLYMSGSVVVDGKAVPLDLWARSDATGELVETDLANCGSYTGWCRDNKSYVYDKVHDTVLVEPGITIGLNPWPAGAKQLSMLTEMKDYRSFEGEDPATGQRRVIVTFSAENFDGPSSFLLEFDPRTKLLVSSQSWLNFQREGAPYCDLEKIVYFKDLPDSAFNFQPPASASFTNMPLEIPEATLSSLSDPSSGLSVDGITREEACQKILGQLWAARLTNDLARIRQLMPLTATWSDQLIRDDSDQEEIEQVLKIGGIERTGDSKLGPLAQVPSWVRYHGGIVREIWMIVQFRKTDQGTSCVIFGPHGYALNVKE